MSLAASPETCDDTASVATHMDISDNSVYRTLRYVLIAALGLVAIIAGVFLFNGQYSLILYLAGGLMMLLAIVLAIRSGRRAA